MMMGMELEGLTALITGSSGSLGGAIALVLAEAGCDCVLHYHKNQQGAEELARKIADLGPKAVAVGADLTKQEEIEGLFVEAANFGRVQILINTVSIFERQRLEDVTFEGAQKTLAINLTGTIIACKEFAKAVTVGGQGSVESGNPVGKIINIVDVGGIRPWAEYTVYCASKAALIAATKSMAKELAPVVFVNGIAPGVITWPKGFSEEGKRRQLDFIPAGRTGYTSEITSAIIFLLENDYITGQVLNIDGGRCI
jgi:NAD(P)-dependent dehydrogenase (short-subunit alcohol dehydrogenase family)